MAAPWAGGVLLFASRKAMGAPVLKVAMLPLTDVSGISYWIKLQTRKQAKSRQSPPWQRPVKNCTDKIPAFALLVLLVAVCSADSRQMVAESSAAPDERMAVALGHIERLAARLQEFEDPSLAVSGLVSMGRIVCEQDKDTGRRIFQKAYATLLKLDDPRERGPGLGFGSMSGAASADMYPDLIRAAVQCDPQFALEIQAQTPFLPRTAAADIEAAFAAKENDDAVASQFANHAVTTGLSNDELERLITFLLEFRVQNLEAANQVFAQLVASLGMELAPQPNRILLAGNYLFGATREVDGTLLRGLSEESRRLWLRSGGGITFTTVGGVVTYNLSGNRPGITSELVRAYLEVAIRSLSIAGSDLGQQQQAYVAAWQLLPKAQEFAPDLAPAFVQVMQRLAESVPPALREESTYSVLQQSFGASREDLLAEYEKTRDPARREELRVRFFTSAWNRREFEQARRWAREIEDERVRTQLLSLADFGEAIRALENGAVESAAAIVRQMPPGLKPALISIGIASQYGKQQQDREAFAWLLEAQRQAGFVSRTLRAPLLLGAAGELAGFEPEAALVGLEQAVALLNRDDEPRPQRAEIYGQDPWNRRRKLLHSSDDAGNRDVEFRPEGFLEYVEAGRLRRSFWLRGGSLPAFDLSSVIRQFARMPERAEAILLKLESEEHLSRALAALAAAYLEWGKIGD